MSYLVPTRVKPVSSARDSWRRRHVVRLSRQHRGRECVNRTHASCFRRMKTTTIRTPDETGDAEESRTPTFLIDSEAHWPLCYDTAETYGRESRI